jgi:hypothetical protein
MGLNLGSSVIGDVKLGASQVDATGTTRMRLPLPVKTLQQVIYV